VSGKGPDGNAHNLRFEGLERQYASLPRTLFLAFFPLPVMVNAEARLHNLLDVPSTPWKMQGSHLLGDMLRVLMQKALADPGGFSANSKLLHICWVSTTLLGRVCACNFQSAKSDITLDLKYAKLADTWKWMALAVQNKRILDNFVENRQLKEQERKGKGNAEVLVEFLGRKPDDYKLSEEWQRRKKAYAELMANRRCSRRQE
ncbi:hypothetical protein STEG23_032121, partial [Scotinomys teguina]